MALTEWKQPFFSGKMPACAVRGCWLSFCLVDESGDGNAYGGLAYKVFDSTGQQYAGRLDGNGFAKLDNPYRGPVVLIFDAPYEMSGDYYATLQTRGCYPLPITELQVRAEQTRFSRVDGERVERNPAGRETGKFYQVEVSDLVLHTAHLPPLAPRTHRPPRHALRMLAELGFGPPQPKLTGLVLFPDLHTVLEVRPLRALRPLLSIEDQFCALNLYQLALMATLSYCDFGQEPSTPPMDQVSFPIEPSVGNFFSEQLSGYQEAWKFDSDQVEHFYPVYEDVPYSQRFEVLPFDPELYEQNRSEQGESPAHPAKLHFFDDEENGTDTQAFISHHDHVILIAVRGTASRSDGLRDANAHQVAFVEGVGKVHEGFYGAYRAMRDFALHYLDRFYIGQRIIICGHSLGGAIALLLAESLRRIPGYDRNILLYTYGAPRAADSEFTDGASSLVHHRIVNHNDPVPSVPAPWMNTTAKLWIPGLVTLFSNPAPAGLLFALGLVRVGGNAYQHHGSQQHFMPIALPDGTQSSILWNPGCESIEEAACNRAIQLSGDMPDRANLIKQLVQYKQHFMTASYIPAAWATLRRWQQTVDADGTLVTASEFELIEKALISMRQQLREKKRELDRYRPTNQRGYEDIQALSIEADRLQSSRDRLATLRWRRLQARDVYGSHASSPTLQSSLKRWFAHPQNRVLTQVASIPPQSDDGWGKPQTLDIDSIV